MLRGTCAVIARAGEGGGNRYCGSGGVLIAWGTGEGGKEVGVELV